MEERHQAWHEQMEKLTQAGRAAVLAAKQAAGRFAVAAASAEAATGRAQAVVETTSASRSAGGADALGRTHSHGEHGNSGDAVEGFACMLDCDNDFRSGSSCAAGHALCADCTSQYVEKTLLPQGIVWWDTIKCVDPGCTEHMLGISVQRCIRQDLVERVDAAQLELAPTLGPEARRERERAAEAERERAVRRDEEAVTRLGAKPCPSCGINTMKTGGCDHMTCKICRHEYYWNCHCAYPSSHVSCVSR